MFGSQEHGAGCLGRATSMRCQGILSLGATTNPDLGTRLNPNFEVARLCGKEPLTRLATLATLSPRERVSRSRRSHQPVRDG